MISRTTKLRWRRHIRRGKKQVENLGSQAEDSIDQHIIDRLGRLLHVRRFIAAWSGVLILLGVVVLYQTQTLNAYYKIAQPVAGGIYNEGILGDFTSANPLYASASADSSISRLVFAGLFTFNNQNQLVGDLAKSWSVDPTGKIYTVQLKPNLTWQDEQPLTAADVVFTYKTIQDPDTQSPLNTSWQDVSVAQTSNLTIVFTLTNPLSSFPYSLTNGIVPQHLLAAVPVDQLRTDNFNVNPIGSGPFAWKSLSVQGGTPATREEQIALVPFAHYNGGKPKLQQLTIKAFHSQDQLITSFQQGGVNGIAGLDSVPGVIAQDQSLYIYNMPLTAANMVFFKTTSGVLADTSVRQALVESANVNQIINGLNYPVVPVREPLLKGQLGYNPAYAQATANPLAADATLQQDGWVVGKDNIRYKTGQPLSFQLYAADDPDNRYVVQQLQQQWRQVGANISVVFQSPSDLQQTVTFHNYDALLYGISIGVDPDVFVYWDSSQANLNVSPHLNFSEYKSATADTALEAGRTVSDPQLRVVKYQTFLQTWQQDAPALGLYQPHFLFITHEPIYGLTEHSINQATDIFNNVQNWAVRLGEVSD